MSAAQGSGAGENGPQRIDKWLWFARVAKTRTLAAGLVSEGKIRINKVKADKPSQLVKAGDVITSTAQKQVRVLEVVAPGTRRGPAAEAASLYKDLTPAAPPRSPDRTGDRGHATRDPGAGRPTKRDRRLIHRFKEKFS